MLFVDEAFVCLPVVVVIHALAMSMTFAKKVRALVSRDRVPERLCVRRNWLRRQVRWR